MSASNAQPSAGKTVIVKCAERELVIERVFDAPRELVFKAWTKAEYLKRWWGPKDFTVPVCEADFRAGGIFRFIFRSPDGQEFPLNGSFVEIVEPEKIVFQGNIHDVPGQDVFTTVTFAEDGGQTKLTVRQTYSFESDATRGASIGWSQTLDHLDQFVAQKM
jgi:uncharacterized protein YndB with AHSA1/START domain